MRRHAIPLLGLLLTLAASPARSGVGDIDPAFGDEGLLDSQLIAALPDGKLLVKVTDGYARFTADGKPDPGFGEYGKRPWPGNFRPDYWTGFQAGRTATLPDGSVLVSGYLAEAGGAGFVGAIARLNSSGEIDPNFAELGVLRLAVPDEPSSTTRSVHIPDTLVAQPDGRILVLSLNYDYYWSEMGTVYLQRFESNGARDATFGTNGEVKLAISLEDLMYAPGFGLQYLLDGRIRIRDAIYLDANGRLMAPPPPSLSPDPFNPGWFTVGTLLNDDSILAMSETGSARSVIRIARVGPNGAPVAGFGAQGTGTATFEYPHETFLTSATLSPDGRFVYLSMNWPNRTNPLARSWVALRLVIEGATGGYPDVTFGESGLVVLESTATGSHVARIVAQPGGKAIVAGYHRTLRLLGTPDPSGGWIGPGYSDWPAKAGDSQIRLTFSRFGGSDGAASLHFETFSKESDQTPFIHAQAGTDYVAKSGSIEWADGDTDDKSVLVSLTPDPLSSKAKQFYVRVSDPAGAAILGQRVSTVTIRAAQAAATPAPATPASATSDNYRSVTPEEGGGAIDPALLILLAMFGLAHRGPFRRAVVGR